MSLVIYFIVAMLWIWFIGEIWVSGRRRRKALKDSYEEFEAAINKTCEEFGAAVEEVLANAAKTINLLSDIIAEADGDRKKNIEDASHIYNCKKVGCKKADCIICHPVGKSN